MRIKPFNKFLLIITDNKLAGISLAPFGIYIHKDYICDREIINHEMIHWRQQIELFVIFFYVQYILELIVRYFIGENPYFKISFEKEAFDNDKNFVYLQSRKRFAWIKYLW